MEHPPNYVESSLHALLPHRKKKKNRHYQHPFLTKWQKWDDFALIPRDIQQQHQEKIDGIAFHETTAKSYVLSGHNNRADKYVEYGPVSACLRETQLCWKFLPNHVIAVSRLFQREISQEWYFLLLKVKPRVDKYQSDYQMIHITTIPFADLPPFHAAAALLHQLHLRVWDHLNPTLQSHLRNSIRFSNLDLVSNQ